MSDAAPRGAPDPAQLEAALERAVERAVRRVVRAELRRAFGAAAGIVVDPPAVHAIVEADVPTAAALVAACGDREELERMARDERANANRFNLLVAIDHRRAQLEARES